ncbi:unnamed protein product [Dibothriocephalus latus]|uniref:Uncharacterized protein n=1 Tax=Dibothriocephalus latus TaxID=60516 RepID=A0A3P6T350_DIBLA|nr:unnamed protein product [Dibothriocephalus latus]
MLPKIDKGGFISTEKAHREDTKRFFPKKKKKTLHWALNSPTDAVGVQSAEKLPPLRPTSKRGQTGLQDGKTPSLERPSSNRKLTLFERAEEARNASQTVHVISTNEVKDPEAERLERKKADLLLDKVIRKLKPSLRSRSLQPLPSKSQDKEGGESTSVDNVEILTLNNNQNEDANMSNSLVKKNIEIASFLSSEFRGLEMFSPAVERAFHVEPAPQPSKNDLQYKFLPDSPGIKLPCGQLTTHVPPRKILPLKNLPRDPLAKLRLEARHFSMGFRQPAVTQSNVTENDQPQMHHAALMQLCEAYTKNMGEAFLYAMARESIDPPASSSDEEVEWTAVEKNQKILDDPTERLETNLSSEVLAPKPRAKDACFATIEKLGCPILHRQSGVLAEHLPSLDVLLNQANQTLSATHAPNPMRWFQTLDGMEFDAGKSVNSDGDNKQKDIEGYGLGKRFSCLTGGLEKLVNLLDATAENDQPKAELLLDSMVKQHVLDMPLVVGNPERIRELYKSTVLSDPMLYKMVMRRRNILPQDLQNFVNEILEITEASDEMLAALQPSAGHRKLITDAAKEMFASGFLSGGPKCPFENPATKKHIVPVKLDSAVSDDDTEKMQPSEADPEKGEEGETSRIMNYTNDVDYEKAFNTSIRNPSQDVLEEVAYFLPEFAFHIRPLFELKWEKIGTDTYPEGLLPELAELRDLRRNRLNIVKSGGILSHKQEEEDAEKTRRLCKNLVSRLCKLLRGPAGVLPGSGAWTALLAALHGIMMWPPLGDCLVRKMNHWLPVLLLTLFNRYPSVREEGCCVLAFLVSCYPLFTRLHYHSRQLLVSNVTFALLDAMDKNKDSYAYFHGVLGYMLHSIPCAAPMECIVLWAPQVMKRKNSLVARDWPRFIYYMAKQWPAHCLRRSVIVQRRLLRVLELGLSKPRSKYSARLALGYYQRRTRELSFVATCWRTAGEG